MGQCRQLISSQRCCVGVNQGCTSSLDCCGYMLCNGGRCACQAEGRGCNDNNECCSGLSCQMGACRRTATMDGGVGDGGGGGGTGDGGGGGIDVPRLDVPGGSDVGATDARLPDGAMCIGGGLTCRQGQTACCGDFACGVQPGGTFCCRPQNGMCATSRECCGTMLCTGGRCACQRGGSPCNNSLDCCGGAQCDIADGGTQGTCRCGQQTERCTGNEGCCAGLECRSGRCLTPGCQPPGEECGTGDAGSCCGSFICGVQGGAMSTRRTCCRYASFTETGPQVDCQNSSECCGQQLCTGGRCVCRRANESCAGSLDCCGAMLCDNGTCRCQMRGQFCRPGGNDCCPGTTCTSTPTGDTCQ